MKTKQFSIEIADSTLTDLRERLARTRFSDAPEGAGWEMGTDASFVRRLADYWLHQYDWRKHEAALNAHPQFLADVDGTEIHFVHVRGKGPNPTPLLLIHAWPDSFQRFHKVISLLSDPAAHGEDPTLSFDLVIPSLPGAGFSERKSFSVDDLADKLHALMSGLGYARYIAGGADGPIPMAMSRRHPEALLGIYSVDVGYPDHRTDFASLTQPEQEFAAFIQGWWMREGAFNMVQSTKPQSLAFALNDSPLGMAAWMMNLFASGAPEQVETRFSFDDLLTNFMIYWVTETIGSSMRSYLVNARATYGDPNAPPPVKSNVPAAVAAMPVDAPLPREWAARQVNLVQYTQMERGGHFSSLEVPEAFSADLRAFLRTLRSLG